VSDEEPVDTTGAILSGAAKLLRNSSFEDLAYPDLADAAGVSERTVYRRFPTRTHLLESLARWIQESHFAVSRFDTIDDYRVAVHTRFREFDGSPAYAFICARASAVSPTGAVNEPQAFTRAIVDLVERSAPSLNSRDASRTAATLQYFGSEMFWARMRTGFDMDADEIFEAAIRGSSRATAALTAPRVPARAGV